MKQSQEGLVPKIISRALLEEKSRGFSLIELLVVISITALLVVAGVSSLSHSKTSRQVKTTAENLRNFLTEARSLAMNPEASSFGTEKIVVQIDQDVNNRTLVKLIEVKSDGPVPLQKNFLSPSKVKIIPSTPDGDNMKCIGDCASSPASWYFSFLAKDDPPRSIGQIADNRNPGPIKINVESGSIKFQLTVDQLTGNIGIENLP